MLDLSFAMTNDKPPDPLHRTPSSASLSDFDIPNLIEIQENEGTSRFIANHAISFLNMSKTDIRYFHSILTCDTYFSGKTRQNDNDNETADIRTYFFNSEDEKMNTWKLIDKTKLSASVEVTEGSDLTHLPAPASMTGLSEEFQPPNDKYNRKLTKRNQQKDNATKTLTMEPAKTTSTTDWSVSANQKSFYQTRKSFLHKPNSDQ